MIQSYILMISGVCPLHPYDVLLRLLRVMHTRTDSLGLIW